MRNLWGRRVAATLEALADAQESMVQFGVEFIIRFHSHRQEILNIIRSGKLGTLVYGWAQFSDLYPTLEGASGQNQSRGRGGWLANLGGACSGSLAMCLGHMVPYTW